jgi:hypothetical protein
MESVNSIIASAPPPVIPNVVMSQDCTRGRGKGADCKGRTGIIDRLHGKERIGAGVQRRKWRRDGVELGGDCQGTFTSLLLLILRETNKKHTKDLINTLCLPLSKTSIPLSL